MKRITLPHPCSGLIVCHEKERIRGGDASSKAMKCPISTSYTVEIAAISTRHIVQHIRPFLALRGGAIINPFPATVAAVGASLDHCFVRLHQKVALAYIAELETSAEDILKAVVRSAGGFHPAILPHRISLLGATVAAVSRARKISAFGKDAGASICAIGSSVAIGIRIRHPASANTRYGLAGVGRATVEAVR